MKGRLPNLSHVDLLGSAVLVLLGLAGWWLVLAPWQSAWVEYDRLRTERTKLETDLQRDLIELNRSREDLAWLESLTAGEWREVPRARALPELLRSMTEVARQADVELLSVAPQPGTREGDYWVTDIQLVGQAGSREFIRFLDRLAAQNPYQSLRECSILRPASADEPVCRLAWTIRFYMLPDEESGSRS